jgi:hypothetical protein
MPNVRRFVIAAVAALTVFGAVLASAAILTVTTSPLGAGAGSVASCDTNGVTTTYTTGFNASVGYTVTAVSVGGIAPACNGQAVWVQLVDSGGASVGGGGPVTITGVSAAVPIAGTVAASSVTSVHVVIV